jgi:hypothetical protein
MRLLSWQKDALSAALAAQQEIATRSLLLPLQYVKIGHILE